MGRLGRSYITVQKQVDAEVDIELDDVIEFIEECNTLDIERIKKAIGESGKNLSIKIENLADQMKFEFIESIFHKYTLEQLEEKLK